MCWTVCLQAVNLTGDFYHVLSCSLSLNLQLSPATNLVCYKLQHHRPIAKRYSAKQPGVVYFVSQRIWWCLLNTDGIIGCINNWQFANDIRAFTSLVNLVLTVGEWSKEREREFHCCPIKILRQPIASKAGLLIAERSIEALWLVNTVEFSLETVLLDLLSSKLSSKQSALFVVQCLYQVRPT